MELTTNKSGEAYPFKENLKGFSLKQQLQPRTSRWDNSESYLGLGGAVSSDLFMSSHAQQLQGLFWGCVSHKIWLQSKSWINNLSFQTGRDVAHDDLRERMGTSRLWGPAEGAAVKGGGDDLLQKCCSWIWIVQVLEENIDILLHNTWDIWRDF